MGVIATNMAPKLTNAFFNEYIPSSLVLSIQDCILKVSRKKRLCISQERNDYCKHFEVAVIDLTHPPFFHNSQQNISKQQNVCISRLMAIKMSLHSVGYFISDGHSVNVSSVVLLVMKRNCMPRDFLNLKQN